jgi:hypothetical protein
LRRRRDKPADVVPSAAPGAVEQQPNAAWLDERLLLMVGDNLASPAADGSGEVAAFVRVENQEMPLEVELLWASQDGNDASAMRRLMVFKLPSASIDGRAGNVIVSVRGETLTIIGTQSDTAPNDLSGLLRRELSALQPERRRQLLESITSACAPELEGNGSTRLCRNLRLIRDVLREPLPSTSVGQDESQSASVDELLAIDERSFWMTGWIWSAGGAPTDLTMVSPEGACTEVLRRLFRYPRPDVDSVYVGRDRDKRDRGFFSFFEVGVPSYLSEGWVAELRNAMGTGVEMKAPSVARDVLDIRERITRYVGAVWRDKHTLVTAHVYPALSRLQARLEASVEIEIAIQCGEAPRAPNVSIIVPLRDPLDALEHQLCQLSDDPDLGSSDLIYVTDSQENAQWLAPKALELYEIYGIAFRLAVLSGKGGPTIMINRAVSLARADRLLLLSPDVVPLTRGWLGDMMTFYDSQEVIGALGPMLLHEDESMQHAGLRLDHVSPQESGLPDGDGLEARSRFRGHPGALPEANQAAPVTAVSGACLMVDRALFEDAGALRNVYAEGQVEDTDLCLRLWRDAGRPNWYFPGARMYYLEGRSDPEPTVPARQYNALLLDHLWGERMADLDVSKTTMPMPMSPCTTPINRANGGMRVDGDDGSALP